MAHKILEATALRVGSYIMLDGNAYMIKSMDVSKTGKHGHAKVRMEATGILGGKKKVMVIPGHERFEVPLIEKRKAQVLSIVGETASLMDAENFENFDLIIPEGLKDDVKEGMTVEYWDVEGKKLIKRTL
jgi:translation initiation factor 5A